MPIKGLSERMRLPRKGIIRIGEKDEKKGFPKALDYFVCPPEVQEIYGETPRELEIILPFEGIPSNYDETLKAYKFGGKLFCRGDGEIAHRSDGQGGINEMDCPYEECEFFKKKECKAIGVLTFLLPQISMTGAYQIWTSSYNSMMNIRSTLSQLERMFGKLSGIPMTIKVKMEKATPWVTGKDGQKKQLTTEVPILYIECNQSLEKVQVLAARKNLALSEPDTTLDPHKYPSELYPIENHVSEVVDKEPVNSNENSGNTIDSNNVNCHPTIRQLLKLIDDMKAKNIDVIERYMTVTKDGVSRQPTREIMLGWSKPGEIEWVEKLIDRIYNDVRSEGV